MVTTPSDHPANLNRGSQMARKLGASKRGTRQGSNPARVAAMQQRLRSGSYGSHKQPGDVRSEREREALADQDYDDYDD